MTVVEFALYLAAGRLLTWLLQTNGLTRPLWQVHPKLQELSECDLCLGFWVYLVLVLLWGATALSLWPWWLDHILVAAFSAFIAHLLRLGWQAKFQVTYIE